MSSYVEADIWKPQLEGLRRVDLLKKLEKLTRETFETSDKYDALRRSHGDSEADIKKTIDATCEQQWQGIAEFSEKWLAVYDAGSVRQEIQRQGLKWVLESLDHGFNKLEKALIYYSAIIGGLYDDWFKKWIREHEGNERSRQLAEDDKAGKIPKEMYNKYTVISLDESGTHSHVAYSVFYKEEIAAIVAAMSALITELKELESESEETEVVKQYIAFYEQYIKCLEETDPDKLEQEWTELDIVWLKIKYWIQVVHDIESGYGEPLRSKVVPQYSIRLLDESFAAENKKIEEIHNLMVDYFKKRPSKMAQDGLESLRQTLAGIYYVPFLCGVNLHFRFAGQSIPNRNQVRNKYGSKIYFDYIATFQREELAKELARSILKDRELAKDIDTLETIVYHIAAHEIGHAIYGLENIEQLKNTTKALLEEPRAELTALHTMKMMLDAGMITADEMYRHVCSYLLQELRRFSMFNASPLRPYIVSAMASFDSGKQVGMVDFEDGKLVLNKGETMQKFLEGRSQLFENILDAEDVYDSEKIEEVLKDLEGSEQSPPVQFLIEELYTKKMQEAK
eukprot:TRINITY_DN7297_c0_g1_i1.p1 TRINITY_DN7297_c0_g1~~TRINITY_DN7297_c0_g1_i1.p1  ORF type:complete len:634 (+),score=93.26 TRINITY_DN7297_c0_g1_i1:202-1902(+)